MWATTTTPPRRNTPNSSPGTVYQPVQCNTPTYLRLYGTMRDYYGNVITNFRWNVDGREPANSANQVTILTPLGTSQGSQVCLVINNSCGQDEYYCWQIPIYGDCSGGGGPIEPEPCVECRQASSGTAAYPNPATADLTVPVPTGAHGQVRLRDAQGRVLRHSPATSARVVLDVRALPNGLYYLEVPTAAGAASRQQVQVQH